MSNTTALTPTGHLQISKLYENGEEEIVFDDHNVITSGMGVGFSHLFAASGGTQIMDYQILNFLVGSGGSFTNYGASTYTLTSPIITAASWGVDTTLFLETLYTLENRFPGAGPYPLARIRFSNIHKVTDTSVRYTLVLDRGTLNNASLSEVGLYMRNPWGQSPAIPILVAYRPFISITKTSDFSLIFRWTLQF
jgi:hypothetical protein